MYWLAQREASDLFDYQIRQVALSLPAHILPSEAVSDDDDVDESVDIQVWDLQGKLLFASRSAPILPHYLGTGLLTVFFKRHAWRVYVIERHQHIVQVAQPMAEREELATGLVSRSLLPFGMLTPLLAGLIWLVVGRSLRPLQEVTAALERRDVAAMQPLSVKQLPDEILPLVSAINRLLKRLAHAIQTQQAFIADAAHELRTPLAALKLQLQLTERTSTEPEHVVAFGKLNQRLDRAIHLVKQLLTLARSESQLEAQNFQSVNLSELVGQVLNDFLPLAEDRQLDLQLQLSPAIVVHGQSENLHILISNIIDNAIRYTPVQGTVTVQTIERNSHAVLIVTDTGGGIPAAERERVFDRFYRRMGTNLSGSGLGLAIARNIALAHRASISLADNPLRAGLTVSVFFAECVTD